MLPFFIPFWNKSNPFFAVNSRGNKIYFWYTLAANLSLNLPK